MIMIEWFATGSLAGVLLMLPTTVLTRWLRRLLIRQHPAASILAMYAGSLLRGTAILLGGLAIFLLSDGKNAGRFEVLCYWIAILWVYVMALVVEIHNIVNNRLRTVHDQG